MDARTLASTIRAIPPEKAGAAAYSFLEAHLCLPSVWLEYFGPLEKQAADTNTAFIPPMLVTNLDDEHLRTLAELEALVKRPVPIVVSRDSVPAVPAGIVLAGGSVARRVAHIMRGGGERLAAPEYSDLDYFISPASVDAGIDGKLPEAHLCITAGPCVTLVRQDPSPAASQPLIQVVVHHDADDWRRLVGGFDFDHVQVAQVEGTVYASAAAVLAWRTGVTALTQTRYRDTYLKFYRVGKVLDEGFEFDIDSLACIKLYSFPSSFTREDAVKNWREYKQVQLENANIQRHFAIVYDGLPKNELTTATLYEVRRAMAISLVEAFKRRHSSPQADAKCVVYGDVSEAVGDARKFVALFNDKFVFSQYHLALENKH